MVDVMGKSPLHYEIDYVCGFFSLHLNTGNRFIKDAGISSGRCTECATVDLGHKINGRKSKV